LFSGGFDGDAQNRIGGIGGGHGGSVNDGERLPKFAVSRFDTGGWVGRVSARNGLEWCNDLG
jgi:hypothetical protein